MKESSVHEAPNAYVLQLYLVMSAVLQICRVQSPVSSDDLAAHVWGSSERYARLKNIWRIVEEDVMHLVKIGR